MTDTEREPRTAAGRVALGWMTGFLSLSRWRKEAMAHILAIEAEAAAPAGPDLREWVASKVIPQDNPDYLTKYGHGWNDAMRAVAKKLALAESEPGLDVERLTRAIKAVVMRTQVWIDYSGPANKGGIESSRHAFATDIAAEYARLGAAVPPGDSDG